MAEISLDIGALFVKQWSYTPEKFDFEQPEAQPGRAALGSPYYGVDALGRTYYMPVNLGGMELPHPFMSIRGSKNIVETEMTERPGTVKEFINIGDWNIVIRGFIISKGQTFPEETIDQLKELYLRTEALEIGSVLSDIFLVSPERDGYDRAVIYDLSFPPAPGAENVRAYEMLLKSDHPFDLYID